VEGTGRSTPNTTYADYAASLPPSVSSSATCWHSCESRMALDRTRSEPSPPGNEHLLSDRNLLRRERNELQRRLDAARANISRLNERRVQELSPDGPDRQT